MLTDARLVFVSDQAPLSLVAGAGVDIPSNVLDTLDVGVGVAPPSYIGNVSTFATDLGIGVRHPLIRMATGDAFATSNGATLNVALQGAPDTGSGGGFQPGAWTTITETGEIPVASLTLQTIFARLEITPATRPYRFLRVLFQVPATTNFTAGTVAYADITWLGDDMQYGANNFSNPRP